MKLIVKLLFFLILLLPFTAAAELPGQVEEDFAVLQGVVVVQIGDEYIVDLDGSDGLREGDILTVVTLGKKIIHPQTKAVIGSVDVPEGFMQVTRLSSGYSYAKVLTEGLQPKDGAPFRRFEQVPARFDDVRGDAEAIFQQLKLNLPQLSWLPQDSTVQPLLVFTVENDVLFVKTADGAQLHRYSVTEDQQLVANSAPVRRSYVAAAPPKEKSFLGKLGDTLVSPFEPDDGFGGGGDAAIIRQGSGPQKGVWMSPNIVGNPVGIAVADLDGDGLKEVALALDDRLLIVQITQGEYHIKSEVKLPGKKQLLSLDALDLDNNGLPELYLSAVSDHRMQSCVVEYTGSDYAVVIDNIEWFLRVADLPGEERVLLGQYLDHGEDSFYKKPFQIQRDGNKLVIGAEVRLPRGTNMFSFVPFTDNSNRPYYAYLNVDDHLSVATDEGKGLWESEEYYGGSETWFTNRPDQPNLMASLTYIRSRLVKNARNEILVAQNDGARIFQNYRKFKSSRLLSMSWNGFSLEENWRTAGQKGYLADFALGDADNDGKSEIVMAIKFKHKSVLDDARTSIVIYEQD